MATSKPLQTTLPLGTSVIINHLNYDYSSQKRKRFSKPSSTIPKQAYSVQQIINKFKQGIPMNVVKEGVYHGNTFFPNPKDMDLSQLYEYRKLMEQNTKRIKDKLLSKQEESKKRQQNDLFNKSVEDELQNRLKKQSTNIS